MTLQHAQLKQQIIEVCLQLASMGYVIGTYGNVSVRVPEGVIVTPSRVDYHALTPADMVTVDRAGRVIDGTRLPSSEMDVHRLILARRPDLGAVVHTHSLYATALSCLHRTIPVIVEEQAQVIGDEIRCTPYVPAGQHVQLGEVVAETLGQSNAVLLANHGVVACGRSLDEAVFTNQVAERVAQMFLWVAAVGEPVNIPAPHIRSERERWLTRYGTSADRH
jgi:L-fuculose-phosphate aldolase